VKVFKNFLMILPGLSNSRSIQDGLAPMGNALTIVISLATSRLYIARQAISGKALPSLMMYQAHGGHS
jgi:hypothetical protein